MRRYKRGLYEGVMKWISGKNNDKAYRREKIHCGSMVFLFEQTRGRFEVWMWSEECHDWGDLLGTNNQEKVIRTRKPTPTPIVAAVPIWLSIERLTNAPRNNATAAISLWSRVMTRWRNLKRRGSDTSSTQTVVNTTTDVYEYNKVIYVYIYIIRTCSSELRIQTFTNYTLHA